MNRELEESWRVGRDWMERQLESYCEELAWSCFGSHTGYDLSGAAKPPPHNCMLLECTSRLEGIGERFDPKAPVIDFWTALQTFATRQPISLSCTSFAQEMNFKSWATCVKGLPRDDQLTFNQHLLHVYMPRSGAKSTCFFFFLILALSSKQVLQLPAAHLFSHSLTINPR